MRPLADVSLKLRQNQDKTRQDKTIINFFPCPELFLSFLPFQLVYLSSSSK